MPADQIEIAAHEDDEVPMLEAADVPQVVKKSKQHAKAMAKMGLRPEPGIERINLSKRGSHGFVVNNAEVYRSPGTNTFVIFGDAQIDRTMDTQTSAARAVSGVGVRDFFEDMAASRAMEGFINHRSPSKTPRQSPERNSQTQSPAKTPMQGPLKTPQESPAKSPQTQSGKNKNGSNSRHKTPSRSPRQSPAKSPQTQSGKNKNGSNSRHKTPSRSPRQSPAKSPQNHSGKNKNGSNAHQKSPSKSSQKNATDSPRNAKNTSHNELKENENGSGLPEERLVKSEQQSVTKSSRNKSKKDKERSRSQPQDLNRALKLSPSKSTRKNALKSPQSKSKAKDLEEEYLDLLSSRTSGYVPKEIPPLSLDDGKGEDEENEFDEKLLRVVMKLSGATRGTAIRTMRRNEGSVSDAIFELVID